jgi:phosphoribosylformimino-5-aminoimidazole carboxamide ribotide isomerase
MIILPAIDLKGGKCVRLRQGREDDVTVYGDDPAAQAADWRRQGGEELHVVDLDGAFAGPPKHAAVIAEIIKAFARALRQAAAIDPRERGVPSSKGVI